MGELLFKLIEADALWAAVERLGPHARLLTHLAPESTQAFSPAGTRARSWDWYAECFGSGPVHREVEGATGTSRETRKRKNAMLTYRLLEAQSAALQPGMR